MQGTENALGVLKRERTARREGGKIFGVCARHPDLSGPDPWHSSGSHPIEILAAFPPSCCPDRPSGQIRQGDEVDVQDFAGKCHDFRETGVAGPAREADFGAGGAGALENGVVELLDVDAVALEDGQNIGERPDLSTWRTTSWYRDHELSAMLTTLGTSPLVKKLRKMRTVSLAIAICASSVDAPMCGTA